MRVISIGPLRAFWAKHPDAESPLRHWYKTTMHADWRSLNDTRRTYPHADAVRTREGDVLTVFNVGGNKYRLVVRIRYDYGLVNVRSVLTHEAYARSAWKE